MITDVYIEPGDRVPLHAIVRAIDSPKHKVRRLINDLGLPMMKTDDNEFTSRSRLREMLEELAGR